MRYLALAAVTAAFFGAACVGQARAGLRQAPTPNPPRDSVVVTSVTIDTPQRDPDAGVIVRNPATHLAYPSGCRQVDVYTQATSFLFRTVIYKFHQIKHWCWHRGFVYDERHAWSFQGSSTACFNTAYPPNAWFFAWNGNAQGGHFSEERAWVTNCVFKIGSWNQLYPDVKIWAHADGSYDKSTGN